MGEDEASDVGRAWVIQQLVGHSKEFGFYSRSIKKLLQGLSCGVTLADFKFKKITWAAVNWRGTK